MWQYSIPAYVLNAWQVYKEMTTLTTEARKKVPFLFYPGNTRRLPLLGSDFTDFGARAGLRSKNRRLSSMGAKAWQNSTISLTLSPSFYSPFLLRFGFTEYPILSEMQKGIVMLFNVWKTEDVNPPGQSVLFLAVLVCGNANGLGL